MSNKQVYSVSQLSKNAGVSVRTLHYYDKIGLLKPSRREDNGYREYHQQHLILLQQIIIFRELDFSINDIADLLKADSFDMLNAFEKQKEMLLIRQQSTQKMIDSIEVSMKTIQGKQNKEILFDGLPTEKVERWDKMILEDGGQDGLDAWLQTLGELSEEEMKYEKEENERFLKQYVACVHLPAESNEVQSLVKWHYELMNRFLYKTHREFIGIGHEGYLIFANQVIISELARELYEYYHQDMAVHLNKAMIYFAENTLKQQLAEIRLLGAEHRLV